jgi:hypothetical protein
MTVPQNYGTTTNTASFLLDTQGYVQGQVFDDPVSRLWLANGTVVSNSSIPIWGGLPITEQINVTGSAAEGLGPVVALATSQTNCTGFTTFLQQAHMVISPGSPAPTVGPYNSVGFFRLTTNQRVVVACDPALVSSISGAGDAINSQALYWDTTNYRITLTTSSNWALPTAIRLLSVNSNSKIITYSSSTASWTTGAAAVLLI